MLKNYLVLSTIDDAEAAEEIARKLVDERLAACVNIIPEITSIYKWKGNLERSVERLLLVKTAEDQVSELTTRLIELHPYDVPEVIAFPIDQGHPPYLEWLVTETRR